MSPPIPIHTVYKYLGPERIDLLETGTIRASQVEVLNDPFEVLPDFTGFEQYLFDLSKAAVAKRYSNTSIIVPHVRFKPAELEQMKQSAKSGGEEFTRGIRESTPLMVCLSETNNNLLMWSHYAQSHAGLVLGFDAQHMFFAGMGPVPRNISRLFKVEYGANRPAYPDPRTTPMTDEIFMPIFLRKSLDWAYEKEWRMLVKPETCRSIGKKGYYDCFVLDWPPELLTEIILGPKMSLGDKAKVMELKRTRYPRAELFDAKLSATKYDLDISYMFQK